MNGLEAKRRWYDQPPSIELREEEWRKIEVTLGLSKPDPVFRRFLAHRVRLVHPFKGKLPLSGENVKVNVPHSHVEEEITEFKLLASKLTKKMERTRNSEILPAADWAFYLVINAWAELLGERYPKLALAIEEDRKRPDLAEEKMDLFRGDFPDRSFADMPPIFLHEFAMATVASFAKACDLATHALGEAKKGASADIRYKEFIAQLVKSYKDFTGKRPSITTGKTRPITYSGKFFVFLEACIEIFAPEYTEKSNQSLGRTAQQIIKTLFPRIVTNSPRKTSNSVTSPPPT